MSDITRDVLAERLAKWAESQGGDLPISAARREVRWFVEELTASIAAGHRVTLPGFGQWKRNPRGRVVFKPGSKLK